MMGLLLASTSARGEGRPRYGKTVVASMLEQPMVVDPLEVKTHTDRTLNALLFDTLYRVTPDGVVPHLAMAMPDMDSAGQARIHIRSGVEFHDGSGLSAVDVAASLRRLLRHETRWLLPTVSKVRVEGDAIVLSLRSNARDLATALAAPRAAITQRGLRPSFRRAIGSGPFRLVRRSLGANEVVLEAFERHFGGRSYIDRLKLRWYDRAEAEARVYESGSSQVSYRGAIAFTGHRPKFQTAELAGPTSVLAYIGFGTRTSWLNQDEHFRRALSARIARGSMRSIGAGENVSPTLSVLPVGLGGRKLRPRELRADAKRASEELEQVAQASRLSRPLRLEILVNRTRPDDRSIAGKVAAALFKLGIDSRIVELGAGEFSERVAEGRCDLYVGQLVYFDVGASAQMLLALEIGGQQPAKRASEPRRRLEKRILADLPLVPLFHRAVRAHYRKDLYGLAFEKSARLEFENMFFFGSPPRN